MLALKPRFYFRLQKLRLVNLNDEDPETSARAILDSGSQRTYVTSQVRERIKLPTIATETIRIKTFGNSEGYTTRHVTLLTLE